MDSWYILEHKLNNAKQKVKETDKAFEYIAMLHLEMEQFVKDVAIFTQRNYLEAM